MTETSTYTHQELSARLAEVERERDILRMELDACRHTNNGLHKDKVELAARAARLRDAVWSLSESVMSEFQTSIHQTMDDFLPSCYNEDLATALAEIRAEAVEAAVRSYFEEDKGPHDLHGYCKWYAQQLRNGGE